ncbi:MAG: Microbial collagenase precursor [Bacteroidota bacterium]|jgi:uncharacterized protein (TIGR02145 family)|nr:Microbial collagenase precursor [Bacteroidota bacterium]
MKKIILLFIGLSLLSMTNQAQTVTDVQGNVYNTIAIGTQLWMKENLRTGKYNDGTPITYPGVNNTLWQNNTNGAYAWLQNDSSTYAVTYGALYNWFAVSPTTNGGKNICPLNWHVPTHNDFTTLERALCTSGTCVTDFPFDLSTIGYRGTNEGNKMKESGTIHWNSPNAGTNSSMFTGLPGCKRDNAGAFSTTPGTFGLWWTSTSYDATFAFNRALSYNNAGVSRAHGYQKSNAFSVRCVCDFTIGVEEIEFENKIQIYPNPAVEKLTIDFDLTQDLEMNLYNIIGKLVIQKNLSSGRNDIDISSLPKGIYLIRISSDAHAFQRKLVIQ